MRYNYLIFLVAFILYSFDASATNFYSRATGNWGITATWSTAGCGGAAAAAIPGAGDNVTICVGNIVTMDIPAGSCTNLIINGTCINNGILTITTALSGTGTLTQGISSTLNIGGTSTITTLDASANTPNLVKYNGGGAQTIKAISYYDLEVALTGTFTATFGGNVIINNNFTITSGTAAIGAITTSIAGTTSITGTLSNTSTTGTKTFNNVIINSGGTWRSTAAETYTINGNLAMSGGTISGTTAGIYNVAGNFTITAGTNNTIGVGTLAITGTTTVDGTLNFTSTAGNKNFSNIVMNSGSVWNSTVAETYAVSNNLTMSGAIVSGMAAGIFNVAGSFITTNATVNSFGVGTMTVTGVTTNAGSIDFASATGTKTFIGKITNTGTWTSSANEAFAIRGGITNNGLFNGGTGTYTFNTNSQIIDGANAISFGGILAITGAITITNQNTNTVTVTSNLTGSVAGSTWINDVNSTLFVGGTVLTAGTLTAVANPNLVTYNAGAQTVKATTYHNLTITSGNTATVGASFTCNNNLSITSGTLASSSFTVTVSGITTINGGILSTSNIAGVYNLQSVLMTGTGSIAGSRTGNVNIATTLSVPSGTPSIGRCNLTVTGGTIIDGTLNFNSVTGTKTLSDVTVNGTGTWNTSVVLPFTVNGNLSNSGNFTSNTGIYTLAGVGKTISGTLTVNSIAVTGSYTNNATLTSPTALTGAGTFSQGATGTLNIGTTAANFSVTTFNASASGNTVNYNFAGAQNVRVPADAAYHHLTIGGTGTKTLLAATAINGDLTISSTLDASVANFAINLGGNWSNSGTFTPRSGTVTLNGSGAQTITKAGGETFNHLTVSGSGTKTLGSAITTNGNLIINSTLDISSSNFGVTVKGNWTNNGTFTAQNGTVTFNGAAAQTIGGTTTTNFYALTQSNAAGVSLTHAQNLINVLTVSLGTFTTTGYNFTLLSTASGTASIATIPAGANFAGNIIMQRYTGTGPTDWRFLSSAVSGATIAQWAANFATSGFTGSTDPTNSFVSIYSYDETVTGVEANGFVAATNVTNSISNGKGFWVYLGPNPVTYSVTGSPNTFSQSLPVTFTSSAGAANDGWNMVANPYPSAIDWNNASWTKTNVNNAIYVYNSSTGSFASYVGGVGVNGGSQYIASQQAFWVQTSAASPVLTVVETVKAATQNPSYLKQAFTPNTSHYPMAFKDFPVPLNANTTPNSIKLTASGNGFEDETFIQFTQGASATFDGSLDAWKMQNLNTSGPNLSSVINDTTDLSINSLPNLNSNTTVKIRVTVPIAGTYSIRRDSLLMLPMSSCLFLEDLVNGNMIDLRSTVSYSFTISDTTKAPRFLLHIYAPISKTTVNPICTNDSTGMAIAKGTGSGPWNYVWKDAGGNILQTKNNLSTADTLFHLAAGVYTIQVSGGVCGILTDTIQIKPTSTFSLASNFSNVSCHGMSDGTVIAAATGGIYPYTYLWNSGASTSALNNLASGNYSVVVTDAVGCSKAQTFTISQPAVLTSGFTLSIDTVNLSASNSVAFINNSFGATTYLWNFGDTTSSDTSQNPTHHYNYSGTYTVILVSANGNCSDSSRKTIVVVDSLYNSTSVSQIVNSPFVNIIYENGETYLAFDLPAVSDVSINIYNLLGENIFSKQANRVLKDRVKLDVENISAGIYIVVARMPEAVISKKILLRDW